jgi:flagellar hook-associated protein 1 FlgK
MLGSFTTAQSGLKTSQLAIENTMNNIANENTPGYTKRVTHLAELEITGDSYGNGVEIYELERQTNEYLFYKTMEQSSMQSYFQSASDIYGTAEILFQETDESGLSKDLNNYFASIENLRSDPANEIYQADLHSTAVSLVENMQSLYADIDKVQESLTQQTYDDVNSVNSMLKQISEINDQIQKYGESPDLLDKRESLEKEISNYVDIEVSKESAYELKIAGETAIFNNTLSYELEVVESPTVQRNVYDATSLNDSSITAGDEITVTLNNGQSITVIADPTLTVGDSDVKQQIADAINADASMRESLVTSVDSKGNLIVQSRNAGEDEAFDLQIRLDNSSTFVDSNSKLSSFATDDVHIEVLDQRLDLSSGSLKATTENLQTTNPNNVLYSYKQGLNDLAYALSDMTSSYVKEGDAYIYGEDAAATYTGTQGVNSINLFSGSSVMSLTVNEQSINGLEQEELDYLASLQWKDDMNIDSSDSSSKQSFAQNLQELRVSISTNKESMDFKLDSQSAITMSLQNSLDQISKVDNDEEMINLLQYQAAYEANAKVITALDEMLETVLNM